MKWTSLLFYCLVVALTRFSVFAAAPATTLSENRILLFDDYTSTNAPNLVWVHEGAAPGGFTSTRAILPGTNHYHRTGWVFRACRTGCAGYLGLMIPPKYPLSAPPNPYVASNLAANLQNDLGALIESPVFTNGIGTVYFEAINNLVAYTNQITVEIATNMVDGLNNVTGTVLPPSTNGLAYVWESLDVLELNAATQNDFLRYSRLLDCRNPIKLRIRRTGEIVGAASQDAAFTVIDNIRISPPPSDVTITGTDAFNDGGNYSIHCFVSNTDTNAPTTARTLTCFYSWINLDPPDNAWTNMPMPYVVATGDGQGNGEEYKVTLPTQLLGTNLEYYVVCDFDGYWYQSPDYTALNYTNYSSEARSPVVTPVQTNTFKGVDFFALTVTGGTGGGSYTNGQQVGIAADVPAAGKAFDQWTGATAYVASVTASNTVVTMPDADIEVIATYSNVYYTLTVTNGTGSGVYVYDEQVAIAAAAQAGKVFDRWTGDTAYVASATASNTVVTMPTSDISLTATYVDVHTLAVTNGTGGGSYTNGQSVAIAAAAQAGKVFDRWTGDTAYVLSVTASNTVVTMPGFDISLTATYIDLHSLTVNGGTGGGSYTNGQQVAVAAGAPPSSSKIFDRWTGDTAYVASATASNTVVTMPGFDIGLTATYIDIYPLTVNSGSGDGSYTNGEHVAITADAPALGMAFDAWTGDTTYVASVTSAATTVTMPGFGIAVTATYSNLYYTLAVTSGTGDGAYTNGQQVAITADAPTTGKIFNCWTGDTAYVASVLSTNTVVTMPAANVSLVATYVDVHTLSVTNGTGTGSYTNGQPVAIFADAPPNGMTFDTWTGATQYVASATSTNTVVTMPGFDIGLMATYVNVYSLSVTNGTGTGPYTNGQQVAIMADAPPNGQTFDRWSGDTDYVAGVNSSNTVVTMPATNIGLTAIYVNVYSLSVTNGTGTGPYTNGQYVAILADAPPEGKTFDRWTGETQTVVNVTSPNTFVTMPATNISLTATYKALQYTLTVSGGTGSGSYTNGQQVAIVAVSDDRVFSRWAGDTAYVANVTASNTFVTMPASAVSVVAVFSSLTSILPESRILDFNDYVLTNNAPTPTWVHDGPSPVGFSTTRALLPGTNHFHRTGWVLRSCRTGCAGYLGRMIPPKLPATVPPNPYIATNLAANLQNDLGASIESPVFTNGIGTIYFEAINNLDSYTNQITVEVSTNMYEVNLGTNVYTILPASTNNLEYVWETLDVLDLKAAIENDFTRYSRLLNFRGPAKVRIRRTGTLVGGGATLDTAVTVIDNIRISKPPADVTISKTEIPFEPGYPTVGTNITIRCYVSNVDMNVPADSRVLRVVYRWRYLDQIIGPWRTNTMAYVTGTGNAGNGERFEATLPPISDVGDLEYYFVGEFEGYVYQSPDYTGTGLPGTPGGSPGVYPYASESLSPRTLRAGGAEREFYARLRPFKSRYGALYAETDQPGGTVEMMLTAENEWRAMVPVAFPSVTNLTWRFKGEREYVANTEVASTGVTYWAGISGVSGGNVPYGGVCALTTNQAARLNVGINSGAYAMLTLNTDTLQYMANRAEYQNFNYWPAPLDTFSESNGQIEKQHFLQTFNSWPTNTDETYSEAFIGGGVSVTNVYFRDPFPTVNFWTAASAKYVSERTFDADPDAVFNARNLALRLKGGDGDLGLGYIHNNLGSLPDGLKKITFKARVGQTADNFDIVYKRDDFTKANYLVKATLKSLDATTLSPETPSISLIAYYQDPGNFYEFRITQVADPAGTEAVPQDRRANYRLYKWVNGVATLKAEGNETLGTSPLTGVSDGSPVEMRLYSAAGSTTIKCRFSSKDVLTVVDNSSPFTSGTYGFMSAECRSGFSNVIVQNTDASVNGTGSTLTVLGASSTFDADIPFWYMPAGRYEAKNNVSPKGIYSVTPNQAVGVYVQDTTYDTTQEPNTVGWTLVGQVTVSSFTYQSQSVTVNSWLSQWVKLQVMGGDADVAVDELSVYSWHGKTVPQGGASQDWKGIEAWVVTNSTAEANIVQLDHSRANPLVGQSVRSLLLTNGLGVMEFDYRVIRAPAQISVQYAYQEAPNTWMDVYSFVVSNTVGWTHASAYLGRSDPGYFRVLNARSGDYTNAWIDLNDVTAWDEPFVTNTSWRAYNVKITETDRNRLLLDESKACYLNNSPTNQAVPVQYWFDPFLQSPTLPKGLGTLSFYARAYTNTQAATVYVYATTVGWGAPTNQWFELCRFENITNMLYKVYSYEPVGGRSDIKSIKLVTTRSESTGRVCVEEVVVTEPVLPGFDIVNVRLMLRDNDNNYIEHGQPLAGEDIDVEARVANQQLTPSNIVMYVSYYVGTNAWGVGNWPADKTVTRRMHSVTNDPTLYQTRPDNNGVTGLDENLIGGIFGQDSDQVVQYYVWATYMGGIPLVRQQETFQNPEWYYPVDLNQTFVQRGWSPYYFVYNVPLKAVWINEVNALDYVTDGSGNQVYGIGDNKYIEIAMPAWLDLAGWSVDLVSTTGYVTDSIKIPSGLAAQEAYTNGYAFFVIGDAFNTAGVPPLPKKDYGYLGLSSKMPTYLPGGLRLRRPLGMYEQTIAYDWNPAYGSSFSGVDWAANDPQHRFVYVGSENNGGSLGRKGTNDLNTVDSTNTWVFPQTWTPGYLNAGQSIVLDGDKLQPGVSNVWVTSVMNLLKGSQNGKRIQSYLLRMRTGTSTNIVYQMDDWYRLYSLQVSAAEQLTSGEQSQGMRSYDLQLSDLQNDVYVAASVQLRKDLEAYQSDATLLNWILGFADGDLVTSYYNARPLTMVEQYWLNADPTKTNYFEFVTTDFNKDVATNLYFALEMSMNGEQQTVLQGGAVLKLQAKGNLSDPEWILVAQYSLSAASYDSTNTTCNVFVSNPFAILLEGMNPDSFYYRWLIEQLDPRVMVQPLINGPAYTP